MKKLFMVSLVLIFSLSLFGCSNIKSASSPNENQVVNQEENKEFTKEDAIANAIKYHNASEEVRSNFNFPKTIKPEEQFTKKIEIGGKKGNTTQLDMAVNTEDNNGSYIVILTEDYNVMVNETAAISYWKYEVSKEYVKLLEKKEDGNLVNIIK